MCALTNFIVFTYIENSLCVYPCEYTQVVLNISKNQYIKKYKFETKTETFYII